MDKFVTKTPRQNLPQQENKKTQQFKQTTIESLQGVVVIEDVKRLKARLRLPDQSSTVLLETLQELGQKIPPRHVLKSTKIGHAVIKLRHHADEAVAKEADTLYRKWRTHFEELQERPQIEVKCDAKSERIRDSGRKFLSEALALEMKNPLVDAIEREVFHQSKRLVTAAYRRTMRALVFKLKHSEDVRSQVLNRSLSVESLVQQFKK
ncbi:transcription elongation factor A N-terminal and central domain-containing protein 2-like [Babylonia areolata]|uniref:transcription elongation factor A N-terminal and central domain-containing protein 2-like n=1 Tax=Babylonia areolata TaxID=304850 RepID=UPI003FCF9784